MLLSRRNVAIAIIVALSLLILSRRQRIDAAVSFRYLNGSGKRHSDASNTTFGFQQVFVINLPERTDRRDAMTLAAALSQIDVTWVPGVAGKDVLDKVLPVDSVDKSISRGNKGSWRAHMNVLQRIVDENIISALILEDDADWDIRIKGQLRSFARAAHAFTQPSKANQYSPLATRYRGGEPSDIPISKLPNDFGTARSPYGDDWDVLWLGHCGTELPGHSKSLHNNRRRAAGNSAQHRLSQLKVLILDDDTVPAPDHLKAHPFALQDVLATAYPAHTRVVHASTRTTCTQAYAVSQQGARKLLWQFGLQTLTTGWDLMLGDWCDGLYSAEEEDKGAQGGGNSKRSTGPVCVTVQPPLFSHHYGKGAASDITAPGGGFVNKEKEMTPYIRLSVRLNMGRLVREQEAVDQWP